MRHAASEWIAALQKHCDVVIIQEDFDYAQTCEQIKPDFVVLESTGPHQPILNKIRHSDAYPNIPRIAFISIDPHDTARVQFFRSLSEFRVDAIFIQDTAHMYHCPELFERCFTASTYIDPEIFYDYKEEKTIPVSVFGGAVAPLFYTWRATLLKNIFNYFPTLIYPHPGYHAENQPPAHLFAVFEKNYAKMINRSHFSLADSTRLEYPVRKHLEIPACGTILISPNIPALKDYGFVHMHNCILGEGMQLYNDMATVAANRDLYEKIRKNGYELVHKHHTSTQWTYFLKWYDCFRNLKSDEKIQQRNVFGDFIRVPKSTPGRSIILEKIPDNEFIMAMKSAQNSILQHTHLTEARTLLNNVLQWVNHFMEPYVLLGIISLLEGNLNQATNEFITPYKIRLNRDGETCWDPIEISWLVLTAKLACNNELAILMSNEAMRLNHLNLRRILWLIESFSNEDLSNQLNDDLLTAKPNDCLSIHWMGQLTITEWLNLIKKILSKNKELLHT